jgi:hypothetical protein
MRTLITISVFLALLVVPAHGDEVLQEAWEQIHLQGSPAGHSHIVVRRIQSPDGPRIQTAQHTELKINRLGNVIEVISDEVTVETLEGKVLEIRSHSVMSGQEQTDVYTFEGRRVKLAKTILGQTRESELEVPEGVLGPHAIEQRTAKLAGTTGESDEVLVFMTDAGSAVKVTSTSKGTEKVELLDGKTATLTRIDSVLEGLPMKPVAWLDERGRPVKSAMEVMGMLFETYRVPDRAAATKASAEGAALKPDVFTATLLDEPGPVPVPRHVEAAVIHMRPKTPDAELPDVESAGHTVVEGEGGVRVIHARRIEPPAWVAAKRPLVDPETELAEALAPNSMIQSDAEEIRKAAEDIVGEEPNAWRAAQKLERWVFENLTNKGFGVAFASALEVYRNRAGDCTEHAVLLAALCRAAGIPTRVVMGFECILGIWGGHAWNEVWIAGTWYPLDATNGYGFVDPLHIPTAHMTLDDAAGAKEFTALLKGAGMIDLDVVEVTRAGQRIRTNEPSGVVLEGDRYENRVWRIACRAPDGYEFEAPKAGRMSAELMGLEGRTAEGGMVEVTIAATDAPPTPTWAAILGMLGADPSSATEAEVDGRPARRVTERREGRAIELLAILSGDALFLVSMKGIQGDAERTALAALLDSMDFDVR